MRVFITGGAGFIGSAACRRFVRDGWFVLNVDKLTYAGCLTSLAEISAMPNYEFKRVDIADYDAIAQSLSSFQPDVVLHCAAETHVDRSISGPDAFVQTNVIGTHELLKATLAYWRGLDAGRAQRFRFLHVSTDEVFGVAADEGAFTEDSSYAPRSPYAASKAAADHFVQAWGTTYGFPAVITNSSNNYGPFQFPEKLIPLTIINALERNPICVYGDGGHVRDWMHVEDHIDALKLLLEAGEAGETYVVGGDTVRRNLEVVEAICNLVDELVSDGGPRRSGLVTFVADRPGHDRRYATNAAKLKTKFNWDARVPFERGLRQTVHWYIKNRDWWEPIRAQRYAGQRLGLP